MNPPPHSLPPGVAAELGRRIRTVAEDWANHAARVGELAARVGVLPLQLDMGGFFALAPDGTVIAVPWDRPDQPRPSTPRERDIALLAGSKQYPELQALLPKRPPNARACSECGGTGIHPAAAAGLANVLCWCGGYGWVPDSWGAPTPPAPPPTAP